MIRARPSEAVVLLHGLAACRLMMWRLSRRLTSERFRVFNWGYRSVRDSIEASADSFRAEVTRLGAAGKFERLHLVTHSMGGIVARRALEEEAISNLGRIVMLAPPNRGSHVARRLAPALGWACPPLTELADGPCSYVNRIGEPTGVEIGIIAARSDRVVDLASTRLSRPHHHIVLPGHHGMLPWRSDTSVQVVHFLRRGRFLHEPSGCERRLPAELASGDPRDGRSRCRT